MVLIIGGAYQGKREWAIGELACDEARLVGHVERIIREWIDGGKDPLAEVEKRVPEWEDKVLLLEDICCGVVPMSAADRAYREAVGRCGAYLAKRSRKVVRVFCGIGTVIKDA